ncbi:hypothetical protein QQ045_003408 [Rhodiola kirilowii]
MNFSRVQILISLVNLIFLIRVEAQNSTENDAQVLHHFRPSLAAIIGVMGIMFSIVVLVVAYAKFCHRSPFNLLNPQDIEFQGALRSRPSGIDKSIIDKIPIFRFSSLRGSKRGLECAVCLSAFEDIEILKLLPKCKHAFHRNCIDEWLESHSSCPLCRQRFDAVDVTTFDFSNSLRFFQTPSNLTDDPGLELFIQREQDEAGPSRFNIGGSFRDKFKLRDAAREQKALLHKLKHRIIVSDVVVKHRWSDLNSSDLLSLNSDMLNASSSQKFLSLGSRSARFSGRFPKSDDDVLKIKDEIEKKRRMNESKFSMMQRSSSVSTSDTELVHQARMLHHNANRSMSEITNVSRFRDFTSRNKAKESPSNANEERRRRIWLPIVRRTLQWFAGFEKTQPLPEDHHNLLPSNV